DCPPLLLERASITRYLDWLRHRAAGPESGRHHADADGCEFPTAALPPPAGRSAGFVPPIGLGVRGRWRGNPSPQDRAVERRYHSRGPDREAASTGAEAFATPGLHRAQTKDRGPGA